MDSEINSNSSGWIFFVKASFAIALLATGAGVIFSPTDLLVKGYMSVCALFLVSTTITLSKTMRELTGRAVCMYSSTIAFKI